MSKIFNPKGAFKQILVLCFLFSFVKLNHIKNSINEKPNTAKTESFTVDSTKNRAKKNITRINSSLAELISKKSKDIRFPKPNEKYKKKLNNFSFRKTTNNEKNKLILLGTDNFNKSDSIIRFEIYFVTTNNITNISNLKFNASIEYSNSNKLQNKEVNCDFKNNTKDNKFYMSCLLELDNSNVTNISLIRNFDFDSISITPFAKYTMNDLGKWNDNNGFSDLNIYILDNSYFLLKKNENKNLYISGVINGNKPNFINKNLTLITNSLEKEVSYSLLNCTIINTNDNNYSLICDKKNNLSIDLQSSIIFNNCSDGDDGFGVSCEIIIINFDEYISKIIYNNSDNTTNIDDSTKSDDTTKSDDKSNTDKIPDKILLGFDNFIHSDNKLSFFAYVRNKYEESSMHDKILKFVLLITRNLRSLDEINQEVNCSLIENDNKNDIDKYTCSKDGIEGKISKVEILTYPQNLEKTNLAQAMGKDLQTYSKGDKSLQDAFVTIKDCKIERKVNDLINITGTNTTSLENGELTLYVVQKNGNMVDVPTTLSPLNNKNNRIQMILRPKSKINAFLNGTLGKTKGGKNVYLSFDSPNSTDYSSDYLNFDRDINNYYRKKGSGLSTGGIIAIIIPCILVLLAVAALTFLSSRKAPEALSQNKTNVPGINSSDNIVN